MVLGAFTQTLPLPDGSGQFRDAARRAAVQAKHYIEPIMPFFLAPNKEARSRRPIPRSRRAAWSNGSSKRAKTPA